MVRFGYSFWGFLGDRKFESGKEVSTPDGNAAYSWSILWEAQRRGWETWLLQRDRDKEYVDMMGGENAFLSFSRDKRFAAWKNANKTLTTHDIEIAELPDLDVVLIEWRFPIIGRNYGVDKTQPDLDRQTEILEHYKSKGTKIILWDLDHKLTRGDEVKWEPDAVFETSLMPNNLYNRRISVEPPFVIDDLLQFKTLPCDPNKKLVYIGSRYERDDVIERWIKRTTEEFPFQVEFWGNWTREPCLTECREMWPYILYNKRITMNDFARVYSNAVAVPILAKESYLKTGFITPRPWEALLYGTIPVGLDEHYGIGDYTLFIAGDDHDMVEIVDYLSTSSVEERDRIRKENIELIEHMDVSNFIDTIAEVLNAS